MDKTVVKYVFITSLMFLACFEDCNCSSRHLSPATKGDLMSHLEHNNTKIAANTIAVISALLSGGTFEIFYVQKVFSIDGVIKTTSVQCRSVIFYAAVM
jgi:hypothetical protein